MRQLTALQQYAVVTASYWAFTITDGALRMLVVFHFHQLGYSTLEIAFLILFYEFFGIVTNLYGGWLGARFGLRLTLWAGLVLQIAALLMLVPVSASWPRLFSLLYVMAAQAISGIAKDLNKMSAKSAIKTVVPETPDDHQKGEQQLFRWVALLTGSKNALKGVGFFLGGVLLTTLGFSASVAAMAGGLFLALLGTLLSGAVFLVGGCRPACGARRCWWGCRFSPARNCHRRCGRSSRPPEPPNPPARCPARTPASNAVILQDKAQSLILATSSRARFSTSPVRGTKPSSAACFWGASSRDQFRKVLTASAFPSL